MTKTLVNITQDLIATQTKLELSQGEIDLALEAELEELSRELTVKADHYAYRIEKLETMADYWQQKAAEAKTIAIAIESHIDNMKQRIKDTLISLDKREIAGEVHKFTIRPTSKPKLIIHGEIPDAYNMQTVTVKPDNERIKEALLRGEAVQGARLEQGMTLRIDYKKD